MAVQYFVCKRHIDALFAASRICYVVGSLDDGRGGNEFVQLLCRLSRDEPGILFVPVLRDVETAALTGPTLWMNLSDASDLPANALNNEVCEVESFPAGTATVIVYVSKHDTAQSLAESALQCELLRGWSQTPQVNAPDFGVFCDIDKSSASPELLNELKRLTTSAAFVVMCDEELAAKYGAEVGASAQARICWCPTGAAVTLVWALANALFAKALQWKYRNSISQLAEVMEQLADLQFDYEKLFNASQKLLVGSKLATYRELVRRTHQLVRQKIPPKSTVLVVSKGDPELVNLENRRGLHYPQIQHGMWAGHHPTNSAAAIRHLETLRAKGADYFLLPAVYNWWLEYYKDFARHLSTRYRLAVADPEIAMIFDLRSAARTKATRGSTRRSKNLKTTRAGRSPGQQPARRTERRSKKPQHSRRR
jgi:hypothetical protein